MQLEDAQQYDYNKIQVTLIGQVQDIAFLLKGLFIGI